MILYVWGMTAFLPSIPDHFVGSGALTTFEKLCPSVSENLKKYRFETLSVPK